jgi:hypothetical protein
MQDTFSYTVSSFVYNLCVIFPKGKVAFGNKMVETTLCLHFESAAAIYRVTKVRRIITFVMLVDIYQMEQFEFDRNTQKNANGKNR